MAYPIIASGRGCFGNLPCPSFGPPPADPADPAPFRAVAAAVDAAGSERGRESSDVQGSYCQHIVALLQTGWWVKKAVGKHHIIIETRTAYNTTGLLKPTLHTRST